jgi:hypothetical protein
VRVVPWVLFCLLVSLPGVLYLLYHFRRQKARIDKLLETLQGLDLSEVYMRSHHEQEYKSWNGREDRDQYFKDIVLADFRTGLRHLDYLVPVVIVTTLIAIGWGVTLGFTRTVSSLSKTTVAVPQAFIWGFIGAYVANIGTLLDKFVNYELGPTAYHRTYQRLFVSTLAAYLLGQTLKDAFVPLVSFGIGIIPYQDLWNIISKRTSAALGVKEAEGITDEAALANIQGLKDPSVREKLIDLNITNAQALAMQDPLELFLRTSFPLRTIVDWIDKAILYTYLGKKVDLLRERGINGAIELGGLLELSDKLPVESYQQGHLVFEELRSDLKALDSQALYRAIADAIGLKYEELLYLIYNLYYDPMVDTLYRIWGRN